MVIEDPFNKPPHLNPYISIFFKTILSTILILILLASSLLLHEVSLFSSHPSYNPQKLVYSTPYTLSRSNAQHITSSLLNNLTHNHNHTNNINTSASLVPALLTAIDTNKLNRVAAILVPDLLHRLQTTTIAPVYLDDSKFLLTIPFLNLTTFELLTDNNIQVQLNGLDADVDLFMQYRGFFVKYAVDVVTSVKNLTIHTTLDLINSKGILGLNVTNITVSADSIDITIKNNHFAWLMNWIKKTVLGDVKELILQTIHDGLYNTFDALGKDIMQGVPPIAPLGEFNGALDLSLVGDIEYHHFDGFLEDSCATQDNLSSCGPLRQADQTIILGFNGETIDVKTRKPLSSGVQRHNITFPELSLILNQPYIDKNLISSSTLRSDDDNLFTLVLDEFVFNSYYDAWYNRGMASSQDRLRDYCEDDLSTSSSSHKCSLHAQARFNDHHMFVDSFTLPFGAVLPDENIFTADINNDIQNTTTFNAHPTNSTNFSFLINATSHYIPNEITKPLLHYLQSNPQFTNLLQSQHPKNSPHAAAALNQLFLQDGTNIICEVSLTQRPRLDIKDESLLVTTHSDQRYVLHSPASQIPYQLLFTISTTTTTQLGVKVQFDTIVNRYVLLLSIRGLSNSFECTYTLIGPISLDLLNILLQSVTNTTLLPLMNQQLMSFEIPTPNSFLLINPQVRLDQTHMIIIRAGLQYQPTQIS